MSTVAPSASFGLWSAARNASPPMSFGRLLHAYWTEARYEALRTLRTPAFLIPTVALPVMLYVFFGIVLAGGKGAADQQIALQVLSGFTMFSVRLGPSRSVIHPQKNPPATAKVMAKSMMNWLVFCPCASLRPVLTATFTVYSAMMEMTVLIESV